MVRGGMGGCQETCFRLRLSDLRSVPKKRVRHPGVAPSRRGCKGDGPERDLAACLRAQQGREGPLREGRIQRDEHHDVQKAVLTTLARHFRLWYPPVRSPAST